MPVSLSLSQPFPHLPPARLPLAPGKSRTPSLSRPFTLIVCAQSVSPPVVVLTGCQCHWAGLAWRRSPKVPHRPDFDGFIRQHPSIISSSTSRLFILFISLAHTISPPRGLSSISSSHHHTNTLASSSLTVIYPARERFILPSFHLALPKTPHQNSITRIALVLSSCSRTYDIQPGHQP